MWLISIDSVHMRIQNDGIAGTTAAHAVPAENAGASLTRSISETNGSTDQVCISSLSAKIAESVGAVAEQQANRVSQLAAMYAKGAYQPDSMQTSQALLSGAIAAGPLEPDN